MIIVKCDMCGCDIDYEVNGVNVNFNHYGTVQMSGGEKEYQVCNDCASKVDDFIRQKSEDKKVVQDEQSI